MKKNDQTTYHKIIQLVNKIKIGPFSGGERVERLSKDMGGLYSRRINVHDRLVYDVDGEKVILKSCKGHYKREKRKNYK